MIPFLADVPAETRPVSAPAPATVPEPATTPLPASVPDPVPPEPAATNAPTTIAPAAPLESAPIEPAPRLVWQGAPHPQDLTPLPSGPEPLARYGLSGRLALGASYQRLHSLRILSGELELGLGGRVGKQAMYLTASIERGRTEFGLHSSGYHFGVQSEWAVGRFRYGVQGRLGALFLRRATDTEDELSSPSIGLRGHVAWDFVRFTGGSALALEAAFRGDYYEPLVFGPSLLATFRWESNRRLGGAR